MTVGFEPSSRATDVGDTATVDLVPANIQSIGIVPEPVAWAMLPARQPAE